MSSGPLWARSACRSAGSRSTATMPCSTISTATRTARSARTSSAAAVTSLHRFDLDSDELIDPNELEPFSNPIAAMTEDQTRRGKFATVPPVIELSSDDPSFRPGPARAQEIRQGDKR